MATVTANRTSGNGQAEASENASSHKQRPVWSKRVFPVQVAVFEFPTEKGLNFSVKLTRTFRRDDDSEWENSDYLGGSDLLRGAKLLETADAFIQKRLDDDYQARKAAAKEEGNGDIPF